MALKRDHIQTTRHHIFKLLFRWLKYIKKLLDFNHCKDGQNQFDRFEAWGLLKKIGTTTNFMSIDNLTN